MRGLQAELSAFLKCCADRLTAEGSPDAEEFRRMAIWWLRARANPTSDLADADERKQRMLVQMQRMWQSKARGLGK